MNLKQHNAEQIRLALGNDNRYFYKLHYGFDAKSDTDLIMYFIDFGAEIYRQNHPDEGYKEE